MMADGRLDVGPLISHRFGIGEAEGAYAVVGGAEPSLGILLEYPGSSQDAVLRERTVVFLLTPTPLPSGRGALDGVVSFVGAGNYATSVLIPAFKAAGAKLRCVASSAGVSGVHAGRKYGFEETTTDTGRLFADAGTDAVVITTRHDSHARLCLRR